jgi:hypothetical protein
VPVTDEQVVTLRAFLVFDPLYERLTRELAGTGRWHGFSDLVVSAFVTAARRRFAPTWTSAQIVRFAAQIRNGLRPHGVDLDPLATETLLRQALGDRITSNHDDTTHAQVMLYVLAELIASEHLDQAGLDAFLAEARTLADVTPRTTGFIVRASPPRLWRVQPVQGTVRLMFI